MFFFTLRKDLCALTGMGATHLVTKTLDLLGTEISLRVLAYNFKRLLSMMGTELMRKLARA